MQAKWSVITNDWDLIPQPYPISKYFLQNMVVIFLLNVKLSMALSFLDDCDYLSHSNWFLVDQFFSICYAFWLFDIVKKLCLNIQLLQGFFRLLAMDVLPCFLLKVVREVIRIRYIHHGSWWQSAVALFALLISWTYSNIIYLSGSVLFNLVCNFQVIHFENYGRLLERDLHVSVYIEEHIRLTHHLSKISHRFRIYLLLEFLVVTASQFVYLLQTTGNRGIINFVNGGDFAVSSEHYVSIYLFYTVIKLLRLT